MSYKDVISGIYAIRHIESGRVYIGSATNIYHRWNYHRCSFRGIGKSSPYLRNAWEKYGADAFSFEIIETVPEHGKLLEREQYWIDYYDAANRANGFNIAPHAGSPLGVKRDPVVVAAVAEKQRGRKRSVEFRLAASQWMKGNRNGANSHNGKLTESCIVPIFEAVARGEFPVDVAKEYNVHKATITRVIKRETFYHVEIPDNLASKAIVQLDTYRLRAARAASKNKLNETDVLRIRSLLSDGIPVKDIAAQFGVTPPAISAIKHGRVWKGIGTN